MRERDSPSFPLRLPRHILPRLEPVPVLAHLPRKISYACLLP